MDHDTAIRSQAAERYLLGELPSTERDEFEEHLSDCSRCMQDVGTLDIFAANAAAEFGTRRIETASPARNWWRRLIPPATPALAVSGALNLLLVVLLGYGAVRVLPSLEKRISNFEAPRAIQTFAVHGLSRGASETYAISRSAALPVFRFDLPQQFHALTYSLEGQAGHYARTGRLDLSPGAETVNLTVPVAGLEPGDYTMRVRGVADSSSEEVATWVIRVMP
jgi:hypothetical protein